MAPGGSGARAAASLSAVIDWHRRHRKPQTARRLLVLSAATMHKRRPVHEAPPARVKASSGANAAVAATNNDDKFVLTSLTLNSVHRHAAQTEGKRKTESNVTKTRASTRIKKEKMTKAFPCHPMPVQFILTMLVIVLSLSASVEFAHTFAGIIGDRQHDLPIETLTMLASRANYNYNANTYNNNNSGSRNDHQLAAFAPLSLARNESQQLARLALAQSSTQSSASSVSSVAANSTNSTANNLQFIEDEYGERDMIMGAIIADTVVFVIGLCGNAVVILVILKFTRIETVTDIYILNLAFADLMFITGLVFLIITMFAEHWIFGNLMCKLYMATTSLNQFASSLLLVVMSFDRFLAVCHPIYAQRFRRLKRAKIICLCIWIVCLILMTPIFAFAKINKDLTCAIFWPEHESFNCEVAFTLYSFAIGFAVPLLLIAAFYTCVIRKLRLAASEHISIGSSRRSRSRESTNRRVEHLVIGIICTYTVCWLPYWIGQLCVSFSSGEDLPFSGFHQLFMIATSLTYTNSALNPILYAFLSDNFKRRCSEIIRSIYSIKWWELSRSSSGGGNHHVVATTTTACYELELSQPELRRTVILNEPLSRTLQQQPSPKLSPTPEAAGGYANASASASLTVAFAASVNRNAAAQALPVVGTNNSTCVENRRRVGRGAPSIQTDPADPEQLAPGEGGLKDCAMLHNNKNNNDDDDSNQRKKSVAFSSFDTIVVKGTNDSTKNHLTIQQHQQRDKSNGSGPTNKCQSV